jgi:hypothetical protein
MSLWVKRIGQLMMAVALFFLSCEEETTFLGYPGDPRFNVFYTEIPVPSSVYLHDSVITSNYYTESINRFLVGKYDDDLFGPTSSAAYTQFTRLGGQPDSLTFGMYDSISIQLSFDFNYLYGASDATPQEIAVYELDESLDRYDSFPRYYSSSTVALKPSPLGTKTFKVDPAIFKEIVEDKIDTTITIRFKLDDELGMRLFEKIVTYRDSSSSFFYEEMRNSIKGLAITPTQGNKILSFNPTSTQSKVIVHFHINKKDSVLLGFSGLTSFNHIEGDRSATELSGITEHYTDYETSQGYAQNGIALVTKLDFSKFLEMADTIPYMMINSAELVIDDVVEPPAYQLAPQNFVLRILDDENLFKVDNTEQDALDILSYDFTVSSRASQGGSYVILDDTRQAPLNIPYNATDKKYNGFCTLFLQELYSNRRNNEVIFSKIALFPNSPSVGKSVNRVAFNKDSVKLRIYYTRPTLNTTQ